MEQPAAGRTAAGGTAAGGAPALKVDTNRDGGGETLLDPETDPLVKDCKKLFQRTALDICGKEMHVHVIDASLQMIDGFDVKMSVKLTGPAGKVTYHHPSCLFETSLDHADASL